MTDCILKNREHIFFEKSTVYIPGDKSMSHRAVMLSSLSEGSYKFSNFLFSADCLCTVGVFQELGIKIETNPDTYEVKVQGTGLKGLTAPKKVLDVGNAGTLIRIVTGILAAQAFTSEISGDESIQKRPMKRITDPLSHMGARITGEIEGNNIKPPLKISGNPNLQPITYEMPVASAQVKSSVLLAGLFVDGETTVIEPKPCRDHTERMLKMFGADIAVNKNVIKITGNKPISCESREIIIPGDVSSAAFFIVLALITKNTEFVLEKIGMNPTRNRIITLLQEMGSDITIFNEQKDLAEPYADLRIKSSNLKNLRVQEIDIPNIIDEIPILAIAAAFGEGIFKVTGAKELRVKESDRIQGIVHMIKAIGGNITEYEDGFEIVGGLNPRAYTVDSHGDHRIAMSAIIVGIALGQEAKIINCDCIKTSFPNFFENIKKLKVDFELR
ncbi:3-phosphoshikimate 1-carboxyvinyltransferase [Candidatus Margulisiibacteriota bacterium]